MARSNGQSRVWQEWRRFQALKLHRMGWSNTAIGEALDVSEPAVSQWLTRVREQGEDSLLSSGRQGQGRRLSESQLTTLRRFLDRGAAAAGYEDDTWTCQRIADLIQREFGVQYHADHIGRLLHSIKWTYQKPILKARQRDENEIQLWLRETWPDIRRRAENERRTIIFVDECGFTLTPTVGKTWSPAGTTPVIAGVKRSKRLSVIGGITWQGSLYVQVHAKTVKSTEVVGFLTHLLFHVPGNLLVLWDRARIHDSEELEEFCALDRDHRLTLEFFPRYAPELDPQEYVWRQMKHVDFRNYSSHSIDDLWMRLRQATRRLRRRAGLLRNLIRHAGLDL